MARTVRGDGPIGSALADGAFIVTERLYGDRARGLYRAVDTRGDRSRGGVLVTLTGLQRRPLDAVRAALELPVPRVGRLLHVGRLHGAPGAPTYDALVEEEPEGVPAASLPLPWAPGDVVAVIAELVDLAYCARAAGRAVGGWQPELIYVTRAADGTLALSGVAPRAPAFAAGAELPSGAVGPLFAQTFEAPEALALGPTDAAADVFALCSLAALWSSGAHPFEGDGAHAQLASIAAGRRRPWRGPGAWEALLARGLAPHPEERMHLLPLRAALARM